MVALKGTLNSLNPQPPKNSKTRLGFTFSVLAKGIDESTEAAPAGVMHQSLVAIVGIHLPVHLRRGVESRFRISTYTILGGLLTVTIV